jgi:hypothetical protein
MRLIANQQRPAGRCARGKAKKAGGKKREDSFRSLGQAFIISLPNEFFTAGRDI